MAKHSVENELIALCFVLTMLISGLVGWSLRDLQIANDLLTHKRDITND